MFDKLPPEFQQFGLGIMGFLPTAALARFLVHHRLVRLGHRNMWSPQLWVEVPTCIFSAIIGGGIAEGLGWEGLAAQAMVGFCGWMGPHGLEVFASKWITKGR